MQHGKMPSLQYWRMQLCVHILLPHHFVFVIGAKEHAPRPPVQLVVVEACPANCGGVYNGGHLCEVVQQDLVEEGLIPVLWLHVLMLATVSWSHLVELCSLQAK